LLTDTNSSTNSNTDSAISTSTCYRNGGASRSLSRANAASSASSSRVSSIRITAAIRCMHIRIKPRIGTRRRVRTTYLLLSLRPPLLSPLLLLLIPPLHHPVSIVLLPSQNRSHLYSEANYRDLSLKFYPVDRLHYPRHGMRPRVHGLSLVCSSLRRYAGRCHTSIQICIRPPHPSRSQQAFLDMDASPRAMVLAGGQPSICQLLVSVHPPSSTGHSVHRE
jgi:hypothetical protein